MDSAFERVTAALTNWGSVQRGPNWNCPTSNHSRGDVKPSLTITRGGNKVLLHCQMGCSTQDIIAELGLEMTDLFDEELAEKQEVARYVYQSAEGKALFAKIRYHPKSFSVVHEVASGWVSGLGDAQRVLYRLPEVKRAIAEMKPIYIVEGEKDVEAIRKEGHTATCNFDGASLPGVRPKWRPEYSDQLAGADVIIVADRDPAGYAHAQAIRDGLYGKARSVKSMQPAVDVPGADVSDHLKAGFKLGDLMSLDNELSRLYTPINWRDAWNRSASEPDWLLSPILERGTVNALFGKPGVGKSLITLEMAVRIVRDGHVVMYVDDENRVEDTVERLQNFGVKPDELDRMFLYNFAGLPPLDTPEGGRHLAAIADKHEPALVVLDTTTRMVEGDENQANTFLQLYRCSLVPLKQRRVTVLRLDHPGKDDNRGQRGSSAKDGDVDTIWKLAHEPSDGDDIFILERLKSRSGHGEGFISVQRKKSPFLEHEWIELDNVPISAKVREWADKFDRWEVPADAGRPTLRATMKAELHLDEDNATRGISTTLLAQVAKYRKDKLLSQTHQDSAGQQGSCPF
jgi:hypothetical protein